MGPQAGVLLGEGGKVVVGLMLIPKLGTNDEFQGGFGAAGANFTWGLGANGEYFWSGPMGDDFDATKKANGYFLGISGGEKFGAYFTASYAVELLRINKDGTQFCPDRHCQDLGSAFFLPFDMIGNNGIGGILLHDLGQNLLNWISK